MGSMAASVKFGGSVLTTLLALFLKGSVAADDTLVLGVDYYPEQWPLASMPTDLRTIKEDLGATTVRVGEFMWSMLEPKFSPLNDGTRPPTFDFTYLDSVLEACEEAGLSVMLGTPTATMPAWLATAYGESVLLKGPDSPEGYAGTVPSFGGRRQYSFNSATYLGYARRITRAVAERYGARSVVTHWQVDNELGHEGSDLDFSDNSLRAWRRWLEQRYGAAAAAEEEGGRKKTEVKDDKSGTGGGGGRGGIKSGVDKMNEAWGTVFWGVTYAFFEEVPLPRWTVPGASRTTSTEFRSNMSPGMLLDFRRFRRDSITAFTNALVSELRRANVTGLVTTNAPGGSWDKALDHTDLFANMDLPAFDNYPVWGGSTSAPAASVVALTLDTARGWRYVVPQQQQQQQQQWKEPSSSSGGGSGGVGGSGVGGSGVGTGWMVAEQLIGAQGHDILGFTPRPQQVVAWSGAAMLAHGATGLLFFRFRPALFGQEEYCYGVMEHDGLPGRKFDEAKQLFQLAKQNQALLLTPITNLAAAAGANVAAAAALSKPVKAAAATAAREGNAGGVAEKKNSLRTERRVADGAEQQQQQQQQQQRQWRGEVGGEEWAAEGAVGIAGRASVALLYSSDGFFAWQAQPMSTALDVNTEAHRLYHPFWRQGIGAIDVLSLPHLLNQLLDNEDGNNATEAAAELLRRYRVLVLPTPIILPNVGASAATGGGDGDGSYEEEESGTMTVNVLSEFVNLGGSLWVSFRNDFKDAANQVRPATSRLAALAGVNVAEIESLNVPLTVTLERVGDNDGENVDNNDNADNNDGEDVGHRLSKNRPFGDKQNDAERARAATAAAGATVQHRHQHQQSQKQATAALTNASATVFREGLEVLTGDDDVEAVWRYTDESFFGGLGYAAVTRRRPSTPNKSPPSTLVSASFTRSSSSSGGGGGGRSKSSVSVSVGGGEVVYVGAGIDPEALVALAADTLDFQGLGGEWCKAGVSESPNVEQVLRFDQETGCVWRIAINHNEVEATASDGTVLAPFEVDVALFLNETSFQ